jgi:hypothetical protein
LERRGERRRRKNSPEEGQDPRLGTGLARSTLETDQTDTSALFDVASTASGLPLFDVGPSALVDGVVYGYYDAHVRRFRIVLLSRHRCVELGLGWVHPLFIVITRDGGDLSGGREGFWDWQYADAAAATAAGAVAAARSRS